MNLFEEGDIFIAGEYILELVGTQEYNLIFLACDGGLPFNHITNQIILMASISNPNGGWEYTLYKTRTKGE